MNLLLPTNTFGWRCESETRVPSSRGLVKQYNQELCISLITRCFAKRLQSRPLNWLSLTFCSLNKIISSIIDITTLRKIVDSNSKLNFLEISKLIKSCCRIKDNAIGYIIEIPLYTPIRENLIQRTLISIFVKKKTKCIL